MGDGELTYLRAFLRPPPAGRSVRGLRAAPVCKELRDERVLVARFDRQRRQRERHGERGVVAERPRCHRTRERGMGVIDPDGAVHQPAQFRNRPAATRTAPADRSAPAAAARPSCRASRPPPRRRRRDCSVARRRTSHGRAEPDLPRAAPPPANGAATPAVARTPLAVVSPAALSARRRAAFLRLRIRRPTGTFANERRWDPFIAPARHRQSLLPSGAAIDQRAQQRKVVGEIFEHALEIPLEPDGARPRVSRRAHRPTRRAVARRLPESLCGMRGTTRHACRSG